MPKQQKIKAFNKSSIYDYDNRIVRTYALIEKELSPDNVKLIRKYDESMITQSLAKPTRHKHLQIILNLTRRLNKNWESCNIDDIKKLVVRLVQEYGDDSGQETNVSYDHKKILKIFFRWIKLGSREFQEVGDPDETKWIKPKRVKDNLSREDLLTKDDKQKLLNACGENLRDRALIDAHFEAGTRPGEILNIKIKHVLFDNYGAILKVDGKTGPRTIRLIESTPSLAAWRESHPSKDNPESPFWINTKPSKYGEPLSYSAARQMIQRRCRIANLQKRVFMNLFRHSEATNTANFMTEAQMKKRHGWSQNSKMPGRYTHLTNADVEDAILQHYGLKKDDNPQADVPKICSICQMPNPANSESCSKCGKPLDLKVALEQEEKERQEKESLKERMKKLEEESDNKYSQLEKQIRMLEKSNRTNS